MSTRTLTLWIELPDARTCGDGSVHAQVVLLGGQEELCAPRSALGDDLMIIDDGERPYRKARTRFLATSFASPLTGDEQNVGVPDLLWAFMPQSRICLSYKAISSTLNISTVVRYGQEGGDQKHTCT